MMLYGISAYHPRTEAKFILWYKSIAEAKRRNKYLTGFTYNGLTRFDS